MEYKLPPLPFAVFDEFGKSCEDRVRDHFIEAIEAQGVPDVDDLRDRLVAISSAVAEQNDMLAQALIGDTLAMLASAPPAPQAKPQPLSDEKIVDAYCKERGMRQYVEAYVAGARFAEAAHGIQSS